MMQEAAPGRLEELDWDACVRLLGTTGVGRVAVVVDGFPAVLPVNYRARCTGRTLEIVMRTRPGSHLGASSRAGFEVDGVDAVHRQGWSVLVRGDLVRLSDEAVAAYEPDLDPGPWLDDRDTWLVLRAVDVSGRYLHAREVEWQLTLRAYL